jgi:hypothetical protein
MKNELNLGHVTAKCIDCGAEFVKKSTARRKKRCDKCQKVQNKENMMRATRRYRSKPKGLIKINAKDPNVCKKVNTCIYRGQAGGIPICNYLSIMGHKRPCAVQGCTVYKKGKALKEED